MTDEQQITQILGNPKKVGGAFVVSQAQMNQLLAWMHATVNGQPLTNATAIQIPDVPSNGKWAGASVISNIPGNVVKPGIGAIGKAAANNPIGQTVGGLINAANFVFSLQFLYILGGFALLIVAIAIIAKKAK